MLTPFPGTVDFEKWEKAQPDSARVNDIPLSRFWLIPASIRPKMFMEHPVMSCDEIRMRTQGVWDKFYSFKSVWQRSSCTPNFKSRLAFVFISKLYRQMYAAPAFPRTARVVTGQVPGRDGWLNPAAGFLPPSLCRDCRSLRR